MIDIAKKVLEIYSVLHEMPEAAFAEQRTAAFLAEQLKAAGYSVQTGVGGTGVTGRIESGRPGPVVALRADMDALTHTVNGKDTVLHSCGHDAHCSMTLTAALQIAGQGLKAGALKIIFQPAEEVLTGALKMIDEGAIDDVDIIIGMHLRPIQEAKKGQATPALYHGASYMLEAFIKGKSSHGARPHLGVNVIDAAAAAINGINAIRMNPTVPCSFKVTKIQAGGTSLNVIPDSAYMAIDLRSQDNSLMEELIQKVTRAVEAGAASVGAEADVKVKGGVPAAEHSPEIIEAAEKAIIDVLGKQGLLAPIVTPGGEDFHYFIKKKPTLMVGYVGLGCDLTPGLHNPEMKFDKPAMQDGVKILLNMVNRLIGIK
jgi:amidohydrolase